ncbi:MAG: pseudouridine-5'-phosphate glycosidase [Candidatus Promineifilaceae bacterium]
MTLALELHPDVKSAIEAKQPVVALESTVITHGLPYPENIGVARAMEQVIRERGAVPATIAILDGTIFVGLSAEQLERLAQLPSDSVRKCSRRDLPMVMAQGGHGATTVAGTMIIAQLAGIELFATGGIGGVHRGHPFDVSADLTELGRTPVTVVCSGAKSILDLPATREVLETQGVAVLGYQTDEMPAFFARSSGLAVDMRVDSAEATAQIIAARRSLSLETATLVTVPVPEGFEMEGELAEQAAVQAQAEADEQGIYGAASTPFLLKRLVELTDGKSLRANVALLKNNAAAAAEIAVALAKL